jgi:hypothetical protein
LAALGAERVSAVPAGLSKPTGAVAPYQQAGASSLSGDKAITALKSSGGYKSLMEAVSHARYLASPVQKQGRATGDFFVSNPAHRMNARFGGSGLLVTPAHDAAAPDGAASPLASRAPGAKPSPKKGGLQASAQALGGVSRVGGAGQNEKPWRWGLRLAGYGYGTALRSPGPSRREAQDNRVSLRYAGGVTEWYINDKSGLEHGFTFAAPPAKSEGDSGRLRVSLAVEGDLRVGASDPDGVSFVDAAGQPVLSYRKLRAWDARGRALPSRMGLHRGQDAHIVLEVDDRGAAYPLTIDPLIATQQAQLLAQTRLADGAASDNFGFSVSLSGDGTTALVGAYTDDTAAGFDAGSAYVFTRSGTSWTPQQKLTAGDGAARDIFGHSVSLSGDGNTALVGAIFGDTAAGTRAGSAYVFTRTGTSWTEQTKLTASDGATGDFFGFSVSLSGDGTTALVGAYRADTAAGFDVGAAFVFTRTGTSWTEQRKLTAGDGTDSDHFGYSVALSGDGNTALVGANLDDTAGGDEGSAYVFVRSGTSWTEQQKLTASDGAAFDHFGVSVSLSGDGNTALVGAVFDDTAAGADTGSAYVFTRTGTSWTEQQKLTAGDGRDSDLFGISVSLSGDGNTALVGAYADDIGTNENAGSAYVFTRSGTSWTEQQKLTAGDGAFNDTFGISVSLSGDGNTALVGAYFDDTAAGADAGSAYVFTRSGTSWTEQQKLEAQVMGSDGAAVDRFGVSVALSGDGNTALVGAYLDDTAAGDDAGSAYVFVRSGTSWTPQAKLTAGDGAATDGFGISVALSSDGNTALVGAVGNAAYVFTRSGTSWTEQQKLTASDGAASDFFGTSVSLSSDGNTALVGTELGNTAAAANAGSAYVFVRSGTSWTQQAKLTADDGAAFDNFGTSVSLSSDGNTALVGAFRDDTAAGADAGSAYVFVRSGTSWTEQAKLTAGDGAAADGFGRSVALSSDGNTALVGAVGDDTTAGFDAGSAYMFVRSGTAWTPQAKLTAGDGAADDLFGISVSLSSDGNTALVGAFRGDTAAGTDAGSAYVFMRSGTSWTEQAKLTAGDGAADDNFGWSVSLSSDGNTALVGAWLDDIGALSDAGSAYVFLLTPSNTPPTISDITDRTTDEDTPITINFTVGDTETAPADLSVSATATAPGGGSSTLVPAANIVLGGSGANRTITLTPAANQSGTATITVKVTDTGFGSIPSASASDTFVLTVSAVNDAPVIDALSGTTSTIAGRAAIIIDSDATVADVDNTNFDNGELRVRLLPVDTLDVLSIRNQGTGAGQIGVAGNTVSFAGTPIGTFSGGSGGNALVVSLNAAATPANVQALVRNITFATTSTSTTDRTATFTLSDGSGGMVTPSNTSPPATKTIEVAQNQAPVVTLPGASVTYTEGAGPVFVDTTATVSDADSAELSGGTLTVDFSSAQADDDDRFDFSNQGSGAGQIGVTDTTVSFGGTVIGTKSGGAQSQPLVVTFNANATPVAVQALLRRLTFASVSDNPPSGSRTLRVVLTDGDGGTSTAATKPVLITPVEDAPVLSGIESSTLAFVENDAATPISANIVVADVDSPQLAGATVAITSNFAAGEDVLGFTNQNGISGAFNASNGVLTLSGTATVAQYQAALRSVTFRNTSDNPSTSPRTITFTVRDSGGASNSVSRSVSVASVNDAPVVVNQNRGTPEDTPLAITFTASDVDSSSFTFEIVSGPSNGTLSGSGATRTYTPNLNFVGSDSFTFRASDGTSNSNIATVTITVGGQNDAPVAVNDTASTSEDVPVSIQVLANDTDDENDPLTVQSVAVTSSTNGTVSISADKKSVLFTPAAEFSGTGIFSYVANDGALDSNAAVVMVQVLAANDAPFALADSYNVSAFAPRTLQVPAPGVLANDSDAEGDALQAILQTSTSKGELNFKTDGSFSYTPGALFSGTDTFTYVAFDGQAYSTPVTVALSVPTPRDTTPPLVSLAGPAVRRLPLLPLARGSAVDVYVTRESGIVPSSGLRSVVLRLQNGAGLFWNGRGYQSTPFDLPTRIIERSFFAMDAALPPRKPALSLMSASSTRRSQPTTRATSRRRGSSSSWTPRLPAWPSRHPALESTTR